MANSGENHGMERLHLNKRTEELKSEVFDDSGDRVNSSDSGFDSMTDMTDRSNSDSFSLEHQSRNQMCGEPSMESITRQTQHLNLSEPKPKVELQSSDEGYGYSISQENSVDIMDGKTNYPITFQSFLCYLNYFAQTKDIRYMLAPFWFALVSQNEDGDTPLHLAIINCQEEVISAILDVLPRSACLDIYNNLTQTPLHLAVITRQPKIVQKLIDLGANVDLVDRNGQTCVHLACQRGDIVSLRAIFRNRPEKIDLHKKQRELLETRNFDGLTPLCMAVKANHIEIVKELIRYGADVEAIDTKSGYTALHLASEDDNLPMVSCLLFDGNANPNAMSYNKNTPLHLAVGLRYEAVTATLIAMGASISIENLEGDTVFEIASKSVEDSSDDDLEMEK